MVKLCASVLRVCTVSFQLSTVMFTWLQHQPTLQSALWHFMKVCIFILTILITWTALILFQEQGYR